MALRVDERHSIRAVFTIFTTLALLVFGGHSIGEAFKFCESQRYK
ncbi:hypothetical protein [Emticicia oligotrophica]|nr:hypothetical protein [Emticicia oligotrophica]